jgi:ABC-type phosphate/phosphonate transport system substrate-binding protein
MKPVATLPMYDFEHVRWATDALWDAIGRRLDAAGLERPRELARPAAGPDALRRLWQDPQLLLGQTCGFPLVKGLAGEAQVVAVPIYACAGCDGAKHRSVVVAGRSSGRDRLEDLRGAVFAINGLDSNTGMNLARAALAPIAKGAPMFRRTMETGSHAGSLAAVAAGRADAAAIDCVSFAHLQRCQPALVDQVRVIAETPASPSLPLITAHSTTPSVRRTLFDILVDVAGDPQSRRACDALFIKGFARPEPETYDRIRELEDEAIRLGYPDLA